MFARVCVEIDLDKLAIGKVWLKDFWYKVEYEGLHVMGTFNKNEQIHRRRKEEYRIANDQSTTYFIDE